MSFMKKVERIQLVLFLLLLTAIIIFFGCRKLDYNIDEIANYGLSNHVVGKDADIEYGKVYTGLGPFKDFVEVKDGERFDYRNVYHNQWEDVHPPLYYGVLHTICSFFPNSYSIWYGIGLNIFWMWCIVILLYKLFMRMTNNSYLTMGILLAYGTTPMFINTILFIRMYAQLAFMGVALAYLIKIYWDKALDKKFYFIFSAIIIAGMLTQYYFFIFAFALCILFALHLYFEKRTKELLYALITSVVDAAIYLVLWRHAIKHVFHGYRGEEAMQSAVSLSSIKNVILMWISMDFYLFWGLFLIISIVLIVVFLKKVKAKTIKFTYEYALVYTAVFYLIVVGKISPYQHFRYVSQAAFIFVYAGIVVITNLLTNRWGWKKAINITVTVCMIANFVGFAISGFYAEMDYYSKDKAQLFDSLNGKVLAIYIDEDWVAPIYFEPMQYADSYIFIDKEHEDLVDEYNKPGVVWAVFDQHVDSLPKNIKGESFSANSVNYYFIE